MRARTYRAGDSVEDYCRACKTDRLHTVVAADSDGHPIRVVCGFCHSEHNYRGGPRIGTTPPRPAEGAVRAATDASRRPAARASTREPFPIVSERERTSPPMTDLAGADIEMLLRRIIREEAGISPAARSATRRRLPLPFPRSSSCPPIRCRP